MSRDRRPGRKGLFAGCEELEGRRLMAGDVGTFAVIQGAVPESAGSATVPFLVSSQDFRFRPGQAVLFSVRDADGNRVERLADADGAHPRPVSQIRLGGGLVVGRIGQGQGSVTLRGAAGSEFDLRFALTGDVDGSYSVDRADLSAIRRHFAPKAGPDDSFDVNDDGRVDGRDLRLAALNLGAATDVRRLDVSLDLAAASDPDDDNVVNSPVAALVGRALDGVQLRLDSDNARLDDLTASTGPDGRFEFPIIPGTGEHSVRVVASDFGPTSGASSAGATGQGTGFGQVASSPSLTFRSTPASYLTKSGGHWQFMVDGQPFYIQGVTGDWGFADTKEWSYDYMNEWLGASGANTLRTYGTGNTVNDPANAIAALRLAKSLSTPTKPVMVVIGLNMAVGAPVTTNEGIVSSILNDPDFAGGEMLVQHLLGWCVGNEYLNQDTTTPQTDPTFQNVNAVAGYIQQQMMAKFGYTDPLQVPVTTAARMVDGTVLQNIAKHIPNLNWLGVNTFYGQYNSDYVQTGFLSALDGIMASNWTKAWAVTEYYSYDLPSPAFSGYQGMPNQTINGTPYYLELNSTANAQNYADSWNKYILSQAQAGNVGGFMLNWMPPHNSQVPAFWKDAFAYRGHWQAYVNPYSNPNPNPNPNNKDTEPGTDRLQAVDTVTRLYGGTPAANSTPQIRTANDGDLQGIDASFKVTLTSAGQAVSNGQTLTAGVTAYDPDGDTLTFDWYLIGGTQILLQGGGLTGGLGDGPSTNPFTVYAPAGGIAVTSGLIQGQQTTTPSGPNVYNQITFAMPPVIAPPTSPFTQLSSVHPGNNYQLRVIVRDGQGGAATASIGFPVSTAPPQP